MSPGTRSSTYCRRGFRHCVGTSVTWQQQPHLFSTGPEQVSPHAIGWTQTELRLHDQQPDSWTAPQMLLSEAFREWLHPALDSVTVLESWHGSACLSRGNKCKSHLCVLFQVTRERKQLIFCPLLFFYFSETDIACLETDWAKKHHLKLQFDEVGEILFLDICKKLCPFLFPLQPNISLKSYRQAVLKDWLVMTLCVSHLPGRYPAAMGNAEICLRLLVLPMCLKREVHQGEQFRR